MWSRASFSISPRAVATSAPRPRPPSVSRGAGGADVSRPGAAQRLEGLLIGSLISQPQSKQAVRAAGWGGGGGSAGDALQLAGRGGGRGTGGDGAARSGLTPAQCQVHTEAAFRRLQHCGLSHSFVFLFVRRSSVTSAPAPPLPPLPPGSDLCPLSSLSLSLSFSAQLWSHVHLT